MLSKKEKGFIVHKLLLLFSVKEYARIYFKFWNFISPK